ncbi:MAG: hypothetical protein ACR2HH_16885 [Chthoniobacterales bacterium]
MNDLVWDPVRARLWASVPDTAGVIYANEVIAIDPATMQVTARVPVGQNPGILALTSGSEALYVARNRDGTVAKVDLEQMTVAYTFAVVPDSGGAVLYATDLCTVAGQPNLLVAHQSTSPPPYTGNFRWLAVYDNGVARSAKIYDYANVISHIEPSADPVTVFGLNSNTYGQTKIHSFRVGSTGLTEPTPGVAVLTTTVSDFRTSGNSIYTPTGAVIDGTLMRRAGDFHTLGLVTPDPATGRVYYLEQPSSYSSYDKLAAYDPVSFGLIRRLSIPPMSSSSSALTRFGVDGVTFRTPTAVVLINSSQLVPTGPPADLRVALSATPNPVAAGTPITYRIQATNDGPNVARNAVVTVTLGATQTVLSVTATAGGATINGQSVTVSLGELAAGASQGIDVSVSPTAAGRVTCVATVSSSSLDNDMHNNSANLAVGVAFASVTLNTFNQLNLAANNLIYDPMRNVLWATTPSTTDQDGAVVAINPANGLMSDPIPVNGNPVSNCIALSANGRYLYLGLSDVAAVHRIDLNATPSASFRIPLGPVGETNSAVDLEVLAGDGTSILVSDSRNHTAAVFDGATQRTNRSSQYSVRLEPTGDPDVFIGFNSWTSYANLSRLRLGPSGVTVIATATNIVGTSNADIEGAGPWLLSSNGRIIDSNGLAFRIDLHNSGTPCLDLPNTRAYLLTNDLSYGSVLRSFDLLTGQPTGTLSVPLTYAGLPSALTRWGPDGFATIAPANLILIARWSETNPSFVDQNNDLISDAWAATYFGTLSVNPSADPDGDGISNALEYLLGTSPIASNSNPIQSTLTRIDGQPFLHILFPRRSGLAAGSYGYEFSSNLHSGRPRPVSLKLSYRHKLRPMVFQLRPSMQQFLCPGRSVSLG